MRRARAGPPKEHRRNVGVLMTGAECRRLKDAARIVGVPVSTYARMKINLGVAADLVWMMNQPSPHDLRVPTRKEMTRQAIDFMLEEKGLGHLKDGAK